MRPVTTLSKVSLYVGIGALIFVYFGMSIPMGALGIVMALLSRGSGPMDGKAVGGLVISAIALLIGIAVVAVPLLFADSPLFSDLFGEYEALYNSYMEGLA